MKLTTPIVILSLASSALAIIAPRTTAAPGLAARQEQEHDDHDHDHDHDHSMSGSTPAPPAESTGCELHVDHYHCEGPVTDTAAAATSFSIFITSSCRFDRL